MAANSGDPAAYKPWDTATCYRSVNAGNDVSCLRGLCRRLYLDSLQKSKSRLTV